MRGFLLDTNVVSEFIRPKPSEAVIRFVEAQPLSTVFISDIVLAELAHGIATASDEANAMKLQRWLEQDIRVIFVGRVLSTTEASFLRWRQIIEAGRKNRLTYSEPDTILAATAQSHDMIVATRDWKPFERVGTPTVDPWKALYRAGTGAVAKPIDLEDPTLLARIGSP